METNKGDTIKQANLDNCAGRALHAFRIYARPTVPPLQSIICLSPAFLVIQNMYERATFIYMWRVSFSRCSPPQLSIVIDGGW